VEIGARPTIGIWEREPRSACGVGPLLIEV
jgi:hypothetical protein